ncbi:hypothetical protein BO82DRAFT_39752 [Aspergillus uvarum CBS 121591]|uniref:Uncharacterized protein n=1 Tax=Aspergillus uvarum CBS 121591 TaxID=1448315 RepID=A0A319BS24_9EURO|nr:hypothetical protein BO82DRAFT_39752 [Aspergillus uvarum CBS 121591]PYH75324.1 hypothetical protein BO82DRAFT_39752 [Aspergillus uvarum CBS 121591]
MALESVLDSTCCREFAVAIIQAVKMPLPFLYLMGGNKFNRRVISSDVVNNKYSRLLLA